MKNNMVFNHVVRVASKTIGIPTVCVCVGGGDYNGETGMSCAASMITTATTISTVM